MPDVQVITVSVDPGVRTNGDIVSGLLNLNVRLAKEKDVEVVRISLRGEIHTHVTVSKTDSTANGEDTTSYECVREKVQLFDQVKVMWTRGNPLPSGSSEVASFPFFFMIPPGNLPPSFDVGDSDSGGSVKYFVHAVAERKSWYQRNVRINQAFPFLPTDNTSDPSKIFPNWSDGWKTLTASKKMRSGIFFHDGHVQAEFSMPELPSIPLFRRIPIKLRIVCSSRSFSASAANDISTFEFPRHPNLEDCELILRQTCKVRAQNCVRECSNNLGLQGGFGKPKDKALRAAWGDQVQTSMDSPYWVSNQGNNGRGRWREVVTFSSTITFRCPPPFKAQNIDTTVFLLLEIKFSGLGNNIQLNIGPLPLSSGIVSRNVNQDSDEWKSLPTKATTTEAHYGVMELPPSYYDTFPSDEKEKY